MADRALITGGAGQLANDLREQLTASAEVWAPAREELDITDAEAVGAAFGRFEPTLVFNTAAFHHVEQCEERPDLAFATNVTAVKDLADRCGTRDAAFVHISTNYVFEGSRPLPRGYTTDDLPGPRSIYALSKLAGEYAALAYCPRTIVVRTAGLYGKAGSEVKGGNFVERMLAKARAGQPIRMVADQHLSPTYTADLATELITAVESGYRGLCHLTNGGSCSWFAFTERILDIAGLSDAELEPGQTDRGPGHIDRPANSVLEQTVFPGRDPMRPWDEALAEYMQNAGMTPGQAG